MGYITWKKGEVFKLSPNFSSTELECKGSSPGEDMVISAELIARLQKVREEYKAPITITSGYRSLKHNKAIGGHPNSTHCLGHAVDITAADLDKLYAICEKYFKSIGDARHNRRFIHLDIRDDKLRRWLY
jgi:uncharacterized protein YcbK (DUF882 family)